MRRLPSYAIRRSSADTPLSRDEFLHTTGPPARDQRCLEVFSPPYLSRGPRPPITAVPAHAAYGTNFDVTTPDAARIASVALLRPCAMTHHTDAGQRYVKLKITGTAANRVTVHAPDDGRIAPPGYYMGSDRVWERSVEHHRRQTTVERRS